MTQIFALLIQMLPTMLPAIIQLLNKPKPAAVEWFDKATKAYLAEKRPVAAFWCDSAKCALNGMTDGEWAAMAPAAKAFGSAVESYNAAKAA